MEKILIVYSNPAETERIRLDKEHRAIDEIVQRLGDPTRVVVRRHAATFKDLATAVSEADCTAFHFSGHGSPNGICLELDHCDAGEVITAERLAQLLLNTQPKLTLAVFMCCFSACAIPTLLKVAPYLITVFGRVDDNTAIEFVSQFYTQYLRTGSVSQAFFLAQSLTYDRLEAVLSRRTTKEAFGSALFEVFPTGARICDSFLIDLGPAEACIASLGIPRESFLHILSRKIRLHRMIFDSPRDMAVLPIGPYVGVLSWDNARDLITCHDILQMKPEISQEASDTWVAIAVNYNDDAIQRYRLLEQPAAPYKFRDLETSIDNYRFTYNTLCNVKKYVNTLTMYVPEQYRLTKSVMIANLEMAERKFAMEDFGAVVFHLECVLSSQHDLLDALTTSLTVNPGKTRTTQ